jgi:hypothetical protein
MANQCHTPWRDRLQSRRNSAMVPRTVSSRIEDQSTALRDSVVGMKRAQRSAPRTEPSPDTSAPSIRPKSMTSPDRSDHTPSRETPRTPPRRV